MANERITEGIVRDHFKDDAHFQSVKWEEQKTGNPRIAALLKGQSKGGGKGDGRPEFIISFPQNSNYLIVVECKADVSRHRSADGNNAKDYAVDGALHYAKALSRDFSVIAIAASGENATELKVSHFYWEKGNPAPKELSDDKLLSIGSYLQVFDDQFFLADFYIRDIAAKAQELNDRLHDFSIKELSRCTIISAILLALKDSKFVSSYAAATTVEALGEAIVTAIDATFKAEEEADAFDIVRNASLLIKEFQSIQKEPLFTQNELTYGKGRKKKSESTLTIVKDLIVYLQQKIYPLVEHNNVGYDIIGLFYTEFIRYAGSEQKLGLVLTPRHITELFCDLAEIGRDDIVYDPCCGTGGFLVAAIERLFRLAGNDIDKRKQIKRRQICGCELRSEMYTYACSNMRFRGDGKSNLYNGDCFKHESIIRDNLRPTVALLNPPYKKGDSSNQMEFVEHALKALDPKAKGRVVAVVQMGCAIKEDKDLLAVKERILKNHHLKAVLSMPDDLFYPIGVVTCIMVFEANTPNAGRKTWFGYFKDDGYEKRRGLGRIDVRNRYSAIKERWLSSYRNLDEVPGLSVRREVSAKDEWCAEAYMTTDYSTLSDREFIDTIRKYLAFRVLSSSPSEALSVSAHSAKPHVPLGDAAKWPWFTVGREIDVKTTTHSIKQDLETGSVPFVSRSALNNGVSDYVSPEERTCYDAGCITIGAEGKVAFYQPKKFIPGVKVYTLNNPSINQRTAMFLCTILNLELYRYNYGNARIIDKIKRERIRLPATPDGKPDWKWMENYIKGLPYSSAL